ncbi:MAG: hypothetical protein KGL95_09005, partial [Patescibacteria group bacterium]|nr:hypothetical protein [Patescibacteria group bacterium]
ARAGHYHFENFENFYPLTGTSIWVLLDCRKESTTYGNIFSFVTTFDDYTSYEQTVFSIKRNQFAHIVVPPGVYHLFAPLTDEPVTVIATGSVPYKKEDYGQPEMSLIKKLHFFTSKYGIIYQ